MLVRVYRNLHRKCYSVQTKINGRWKVTDHADVVYLRGVTFKVSPSGRERVIRERKKNVHAYCVGERITEKEYQQQAYSGRQPFPTIIYRVRYNPYIAGHFFVDDGRSDKFVNSASVCMLTDKGMWAGGVNIQ